MTRTILFTLCLTISASIASAQMQWRPPNAPPEIDEATLKRLKINKVHWNHMVEMPRPDRWGKKQPSTVACIWIPEGVKQVRGLFWPGGVGIDKGLGTDGRFRNALKKHNMGVFFFPNGGIHQADEALKKLAKKSGHPELPLVPYLTAGHSAAGLFCRNVGYLMPDRTIGVIMIKSGNFHHAIPDFDASLKTVPLVHFSGEFEEFGPEGGDMGAGLRSAYVSEPTEGPRKRRNQTQWIMTRMQMLDRRRKHEDNVWTLVTERGGRHTSWRKPGSTELLITWVNGVVEKRLPKEWDGKSVLKCIPQHAKDGWLFDADIKNPKHKPAAYADYTGDKKLAFWAPDETVATAIYDYYAEKPWSHPDPTADLPIEERFYPPPLLQDYVDAPPPAAQTWSGGDLTWTKEATGFKDSGKWVRGKRTVFAGSGGTITVPENIGTEGLVLGSGYKLNLGEHRVSSGYHIDLQKGSEVHVQLHKKSSGEAGKRGAYIYTEGNGKVAGKLVVTIADGLPIGLREGLRENKYGIVKVKGTRTGTFDEIVLPDKRLKTQWIGDTLCVIVPKVLTAAEKAAEKKRMEKKFEEKGLVPGLDKLPEERDGPPALMEDFP